MTPMLPAALLGQPVAHRGFHDIAAGRPENSRAAIRAAIDAGYGVEIDLQLTRDGQAVVFHDYDMGRLTGRAGPIRQISAAEAAEVALLHGDGEGIPTLAEILDLAAGRAPLLIELKDQDGGMGPDVGPLEQATADALAGYRGAVAVMSFNPHSIAAMARLAPDLPRGLVTSAYDPAEWPLSLATCERLRDIPDYDRVGASFISHEVEDLSRPRVAELKARSVPVLCWTVRSAEQEAEARRIADNITFEGYAA
ncbi:phosphodiesterase [Ruegeria pomeroyi]|uniref:Glycerophosphoryl diester phosphodiesterase, putative n=2 Tax=Ruegeria pomeroyi TaxID=89184 RepID=Q5LM33_RUEPO|nr:glycerophosphodiester phosphodiesterase family protein [Ruegeria pomeroyi]HCE72769.1 phosphodiesterase [Ruegeria sp.]AAV96952.1 glycerophosphoryl diester phosphodiesterase, putative [Ruegeria pomeroyi DSS-3]NVK97998.1 phosphodiesterase [Ruegeria pomeroyi]NVL02437.1 phosphodiesterase [Ruegeria pomeroyi]QWV10481.1 phosphodiesterase [Ruegeria pomeroyi]